MNNYTVMNLSMISRLAVLENAGRTGDAIDLLVGVIRYWSDTEQSISTIEAEMKVVEKMFALHQLRKGDGFCGIVNNEVKQLKCYISKGELVSLVDVAIGKKQADHRDCLEVIVSVIENEGQVVVVIKDNGDTDENEQRESLEDKYRLLRERYSMDDTTINVVSKPTIGTVVKVVMNQ